MKTCVEVLSPDRLSTILGTVTGGRMAATLLGLVVWGDGKSRRTFIKCFPKGSQLGIVNEVTGYIIGRGCELPVPSRAGLMQMPEQFSSAYPHLYPVAFVVSEAPGQVPLSYFGLPPNAPEALLTPVLELIRRWTRLNEALAFDDWTANCDRHLGNLIVGGENSIYLIDHSNLPVTLSWEAEQLDPDTQFESRLMRILNIQKEAKLPDKAAIATAANNHQAVYEKVAGELRYWWDRLLKNDPFRRHALEHFIKNRADNGKGRVTDSLGLLIV